MRELIGVYNASALAKIGASKEVQSKFLRTTLSFEQLSPSSYAEAYLNIQHKVLSDNHCGSDSLQSQIIRLIEQMSQRWPRGIVFIDYDGTIINSDIPIIPCTPHLHAGSACSEHFHTRHYNV